MGRLPTPKHELHSRTPGPRSMPAGQGSRGTKRSPRRPTNGSGTTSTAADRRIAAKLLPPPVIPPGDTLDHERAARKVEHSSGGIPEPEEGITDRRAAAYVNRQSPPRPHPVVGPYNQDDALLRACALVARELDPLRAGATDYQIFQALIQWPTQRVSGNPHGNPWAVCGGSDPRFWYDTGAMDDFPVRKRPTLEGDALVKAVRRVMHISRPKSSKADKQPARKAVTNA